MLLDAPRAPDPWRVSRELAAVLELPRLAWRARFLLSLPRGDGAPAIVLPGFGAGAASTAMLRAFLRGLGYDARGWGLGRNRGDVAGTVPRLIARAEALHAERGEPLRLVGWSLGGVLARELARERPELVARVVTLGTPVVGGPKYTLAAEFYRRQGVDLDALETQIAEREKLAIERPITAIYSRRDAVVAWQACIDRGNPSVRHVEVEATHAGLGFNPEVYELVARALDPGSPPHPAEAGTR
jgi:pimeloyl-ACP methyl ester carboxylesterase